MTLLYNFVAQPLYLLQGDIEIKGKTLIYVVSNVIFNIFLFRMLAEPVLFVMQL